MIDTHCHLTDPRLLDQLPAVLSRAHAAGVSHLISIGTEIEDDQKAVALCQGRDAIRCAIGIHPNYCANAELTDLDLLRTLSLSPSVVALGEMGLDYHYPPVDRPRQMLFLRRQLELAVERGLPVVIHCREAVEDTLTILWDFPTIRGVFHCFTGTIGESTRILEAGYLLGFTGPVTFKKSDELREVARRVPSDRLLVETDSPYLSPEPVRGQKVNEPALVMHVAARIAKERGIALQALDAMTTANASRLFGWPRSNSLD
jgi:TatD DNase family protein